MKVSAKKYSFFAGIIAIILTFSISASAAYVGSSYISSMGACVIDYDTGDIYYEYNGYAPRVPASMTKLMNLYCVYEAVAEGKIDIYTPVPISANAYSKSRNPDYQTVPLYYNTLYTVDELIGMVLTYSDIGSAVALAELVAGSEWAFVQIMNDKAKEMGADAYFYDCFGVAHNQVSPLAIATIVKNFISKYPDILVRSSKRSVNFHGRTYYSTNHLYDTYYYPGADGMKTGTTNAAGYCFCATASRDGRRMIAVTMASSSSAQRFRDATVLLDYGFNAAKAKYGTIFYTDTSTFINSLEIPTFAYMGKIALIAQDLTNYGFDASYNDETRTLTLSHNPSKLPQPMSVAEYKGKEGKEAFPVSATDIKIEFVKDGQSYVLANSYNTNGYMCLLLDDLLNICNVGWNQEQRKAEITIN
ncbi:MAG: D-alanyl-D-alanine carboxypeptidase [Clostridia bacterium]|nr:D-alanyl-D-alanine carboxypeptidase [Clostridia bacterium]